MQSDRNRVHPIFQPIIDSLARTVRRLNVTFDPKCYELAKFFLADEPTIDSEKNRTQLAQEIQSTIENNIEDMKLRDEQPE